ncbi:unnamed protein product [Gadus morhua 'NCC']
MGCGEGSHWSTDAEAVSRSIQRYCGTRICVFCKPKINSRICRPQPKTAQGVLPGVQNQPRTLKSRHPLP